MLLRGKFDVQPLGRKTDHHINLCLIKTHYQINSLRISYINYIITAVSSYVRFIMLLSGNKIIIKLVGWEI